MQIILIKDVDNLGLAGQVLNVAPGYARNYLLPGGMALVASEGNLKMLAKKRAEYEARAKEEKERALELKDKLNELKLVFNRKAGERDKLYGAVTAMDIAQAIEETGFAIDRKRLRLGEPIKSLGEFEISIRLHPEVLASFKVLVMPEQEASSSEEGADKE